MTDPTRQELLAYIKNDMFGEYSEFGIERALYWLAADNHGGQGSNLYAVLSTSKYTPGRAEHGPGVGEANTIYDILTDAMRDGNL